MEFIEPRTEQIPLALPNGTTIKVEVSQMGREDVAFQPQSFGDITAALEGIIEAISRPLKSARPDKASVKFGVEVAVDSGGLTAVIVKGSGKANLEITLEWEKQ